MLTISASSAWRNVYPGAIIGLLELSHVEFVPVSPELEEKKRSIERVLRERFVEFSRKDFLSLPAMSAYERYYKRFNKTYHVLQQVESIALKGKNLPAVTPLVDSNFIAEVDTLILTAGHDASMLQGPVTMDIAREGDSFTQMGGAVKTILAGDMVMRDMHGVCCSIIYGQDNISPISPQTSHVLYVAYAPPGITGEQVNAQLVQITENVRLFSPAAVVEQQKLLTA